MIKRKNQAGFTIFEIMIATSIFAVVLVVLAAGVVSFSNAYFNGVNSTKTQAVARSIIDDISQNIQFGRTVTSGLSGTGGLEGICIDNTLYSYHIGYEVAGTPDMSKHQAYHGLVKSTGGNDCSATPPKNVHASGSLSDSEHDLLGEHMRLGNLFISETSNNLYTIGVRVIYGDDDFLQGVSGGSTDWSTVSCVTGDGSQFCSIVDLSTTVQQRVAK